MSINKLSVHTHLFKENKDKSCDTALQVILKLWQWDMAIKIQQQNKLFLWRFTEIRICKTVKFNSSIGYMYSVYVVNHTINLKW